MKLNFSYRCIQVVTLLCTIINLQASECPSAQILLSASDTANIQKLYPIELAKKPVTLSRVSHLSTLAPQLDSLNSSVCVSTNGGTWYRNCPQEPWLAINPTNPKNMICGMIQDRLTIDEALGIAVYFTFDGGRTWKESNVTRTITQNPTIPLSLEYFQNDADPNITFDFRGTAYMLGIPFSALPTIGLPDDYIPEALTLTQSLDGGMTWTKPTYIVQDGGTNFLDRQTLWADPQRKNVIYALWTDDLGLAGTPPNQCLLKFARSRDGGNTWDAFTDKDGNVNPFVVLFSVPQDESNLNNVFFMWYPTLTVLPDGSLITTIKNSQIFVPTGSPIPSQFIVIRSTDGGNTWNPIFTRDFTAGAGITPGGQSFACFIFGVDTAFNAARGKNGTLYAVASDSAFAPNPALNGSTIAMSTDGGFTWTKPKPINKLINGQQLHQPSFPTVAVAADGVVGVLYSDFRNPDKIPFEQVAVPTDWWLVLWKADLSEIIDEIRITPVSFDFATASYRDNTVYGIELPTLMLGDYVRLLAEGNDFVAVIAVTNPDVTPADSNSVFFNPGAPLLIDDTRRQDILFAHISRKTCSEKKS